MIPPPRPLLVVDRVRAQNFCQISDFVSREIWLKFREIKISYKRQIWRNRNLAKLKSGTGVTLPLPTVHCPLSAAHCLMSTVYCLSIVYCPLFTVHCHFTTAHCPLFTAHCPLPTGHCACSISAASLVILAF